MQDEDIGIAGFGAALPKTYLPLAELPLVSPPENLAALAFTGAPNAGDTGFLALRAAREALMGAALEARDIDMLLWASARPAAHVRASATPTGGVLDEFCYSGSWFQEELGLDRAVVNGIAQQGCAGLFAALRMARALLVAEPEMNHVLCVGVDALPAGSCR